MFMVFGKSNPFRPSPLKDIIIVVLAMVFIVVAAEALILNGRLGSAHSSLADTSALYNTSRSQLAAAENDLSSANATISSLLGSLDNKNGTISGLNDTVSDLLDQIDGLQSQISSLQTNQNSQVSNLQSQNSGLQTLLNLQNSTTEVSSEAINQTSGESNTILVFTAPYAGYLTITGNATSNSIITVNDTYGTPSLAFNFTSGETLAVPVLPGDVSVAMTNSNSTGNMTANMTVTYTD